MLLTLYHTPMEVSLHIKRPSTISMFMEKLHLLTLSHSYKCHTIARSFIRTGNSIHLHRTTQSVFCTQISIGQRFLFS